MPTATHLSMTGRALAEALLDLALPSVCAACDEGGPGPLCPACEADLTAALFALPLRTTPDPVPIHLPPVTARGRYAGVLRTVVAAYKDDDRRDLRAVLSPLLAESLVVASRMRAVVVVPVPSSRSAVRRRGDDPVADLVRAAAGQLGGCATVVPALRPVRRLADQSTLGQQARAANLAGAYAVRSRSLRALDGRLVVLADDVVTTGATLAEAARAVRAAGGLVVGAATIAATQRRSPSRTQNHTQGGPPGRDPPGTAPAADALPS